MRIPYSAMQSMNFVGGDDVRRVFRHLNDHAVASVLELKPTAAQLKEAAARLGGASDIFKDIRPGKGVVEAIVELAGADEDYAEERR
jgi:hypothetical protein